MIQLKIVGANVNLKFERVNKTKSYAAKVSCLNLLNISLMKSFPLKQHFELYLQRYANLRKAEVVVVKVEGVY